MVRSLQRGYQAGYKQPDLPPLFDGSGFRLHQANLNNRFASPSAGLFGLMGIAAVYDFTDGVIEQVRLALNAENAVKIPGGGILQPNAIRFSCKHYGRLYCIAGTTNPVQWLSLLWPASARAMAGVPGKIYAGIADIADDGYAAIANDARTINSKDEPVTLIGHSLGGSMAELWAHKLRNLEGFTDVAATTYGAPRHGTPDYAETKGKVDMERVVNRDDPVCNVLPSIYARALDTNSPSLTGSVTDRYRHREPRAMVYESNTFGREFQQDGSVSAALSDLASLATGAHRLLSVHLLKTYGARALAQSFIPYESRRGRDWAANAEALAGILFD